MIYLGYIEYIDMNLNLIMVLVDGLLKITNMIVKP